MDQVIVESNVMIDLMFSITRGDQSERSRAFADTRDLTAMDGIYHILCSQVFVLFFNCYTCNYFDNVFYVCRF